uniref:Uncharacterized protein n=1 Tax=Anguilla anguilla TaxID=7936 RepID=A0A0E9RZJ3_ANGAN
MMNKKYHAQNQKQMVKYNKLDLFSGACRVVGFFVVEEIRHIFL